MDKFELLNKLFSDSAFLEQNKDKKEFEDIYAAVIAVEPSVTKEELDEYLVKMSECVEKHLNGELDEKALEDVNGGSGFLTIALVGSIIAGCYYTGLAIGEAIAHYRNRKKK